MFQTGGFIQRNSGLLLAGQDSPRSIQSADQRRLDGAHVPAAIERFAREQHQAIGPRENLLRRPRPPRCPGIGAAGGGINIVALVFWFMGIFSMRSSIEEHFNSAEPIGLRLSGVMTFFFNAIYFQYHFNEIAQAKKAQQLSLTQHA